MRSQTFLALAGAAAVTMFGALALRMRGASPSGDPQVRSAAPSLASHAAAIPARPSAPESKAHEGAADAPSIAAAPAVEGQRVEAAPASTDAGDVGPAGGRAHRAASRTPPRGSLRGRLRLEKGEAETARVLCATRGALALDAPVARLAEHDAALTADIYGDLRAARPDADGAFTFVDLPAGRVRLAIRVPRRVPIDLDGLWLLAGETLDLGELVPDRGRSVAGRVVDENGAAVPGARVYSIPDAFQGAWQELSWRAGTLRAVCDASGEFRVDGAERGDLRWVAHASERAGQARVTGWSSNSIELTFEPTRAAELTLDDESCDDDPDRPGWVIQAWARDWGFARLRLARPLAGTRADELDATRARRIGELALARATLPFENERWLEDEEPLPLPREQSFRLRRNGVHEAAAWPPRAEDRPDALSRRVLLMDGPEQHERLARPGERGIEFRVLDGDSGGEVEHFVAHLVDGWPDALPRPAGVPRAPREFLAGRFDARAFQAASARWNGIVPRTSDPTPTFDDIPESGPLQLWIEAEGFDLLPSATFELTSNRVHPLGDLRLRRLPALFVRALEPAPPGVSPDGIADATVTLVASDDWGGPGRAHSEARSNASGHARLTSLVKSPADLYVSAPGRAPWHGPAPRTFDPDLPFQVTLDRAAELVVHVLGPNGNPARAEVFRLRTPAELAYAQGDLLERALCDREGTARFGELEAGMVSFAARPLADASLELDAGLNDLTWSACALAAGDRREVELRLPPSLNLGLRVRWRGQPLEGALVHVVTQSRAFDPAATARGILSWGPARRCDDLGDVEFAGLLPGGYSVSVSALRFPAPVVRSVWVEASTRALPLELAQVAVSGHCEFADHVPFEMRAGEPRVVLRARPYLDVQSDDPELEVGDCLADWDLGAAAYQQVGQPVEHPFEIAGLPQGTPLILSAVVAVPHERTHLLGEAYVGALSDEAPLEGFRIVLSPAGSLTLQATQSGLAPGQRFGFVAYDMEQPWGSGFIARACPPESPRSLELPVVPTGHWRVALLALRGGQWIERIGAWVELEVNGNQFAQVAFEP